MGQANPFFGSAVFVAAVLGISVAPAAPARRAPQPKDDRAAIEQLHQLDVETTLTDKADELAKLWDKDAVRIQPGRLPEIGKAAIYASDKQWQVAEHMKTVCYKAEIKDLQIDGEWAFEWGYFSYRTASDQKAGRGKMLRVLKRQSDGSWKFARVIGFPEQDESAAPMAQPCK